MQAFSRVRITGKYIPASAAAKFMERKLFSESINTESTWQVLKNSNNTLILNFKIWDIISFSGRVLEWCASWPWLLLYNKEIIPKLTVVCTNSPYHMNQCHASSKITGDKVSYIWWFGKVHIPWYLAYKMCLWQIAKKTGEKNNQGCCLTGSQ